MTVFLGVDGGGTKTGFCLVDHRGDVVGQVAAGGSYHWALGLDGAAQVIRDGVRDVCAVAGVAPADIAHAFFGIPGYGESRDLVPVLDAIPAAVLGHDRYRCDNDMVCAWAGSLGALDGIAVVGGTGSMAYGEHDGLRARAGGWGEVFGDEGSAHWIGVRGLGAFSRMSDGRLPRGALHPLIRERLGLTEDIDLVDVVLTRWAGGRAEVAAVAPLVTEAAARGDAVAAGILADAGVQLAEVAAAVRVRLGYGPGATVPVSCSGGVFSAGPVLAAFGRALAALDPGYDLRAPLHPPAVGAALYAARLAGTPLRPGAVDRLPTVGAVL